MLGSSSSEIDTGPASQELYPIWTMQLLIFRSKDNEPPLQLLDAHHHVQMSLKKEFTNLYHLLDSIRICTVSWLDSSGET